MATPKKDFRKYVEDGKIKLGRGETSINEMISAVDQTKNGKLKRLASKTAESHKDIPKTIKGVVGRQMFSAIVTSKKLYKEGILFSTNPEHSVLNRDMANDWNINNWREEIVYLKGAAKEIVAPAVTFKYPYIDTYQDGLVNITRFFKENIVINYGVAKSIIDDETFNIIKEFLKTFEVWYDPKTLEV